MICMKNDFDYIKDKFDNDNLSIPDEISEYAILDKLADKPKLKLYQKKSFKAAVSAVACLVLAVGVFAAAVPQIGNNPVLGISTVKNPTQPQVLESFDSYSQIQKMAKKTAIYNAFSDIKFGLGFDEDKAAEAVETDTALKGSSHGDTYVQVNGIDEGDILKNDGRYMYYVNLDNEIFIYEGETLVSKIDDFAYDANHEDYLYIDDIYVRGTTLVVNSSSDMCKGGRTECFTKSSIYDLRNIASPVCVEEFEQTGNYNSSRMIGDTLYVVSSNYIYYCDKPEDCYIKTAQGKYEEVLSPAAIYRCDNTVENNYVVISAIDTKSCQRSARTKAIYGCGTDIYCNDEFLYIAIANGENTQIVKASLNSDEISFVAKGKVKGHIHNQFSMDEKDGYFRIATTDGDANNLYVLDSDLNKVGEVTGFAKDEDIQAVKYIGDMAYVITYEFTDPLFVIDLSEPTNPTIKGSVKITGFSSQLLQIDENTILGIGQDDSGCDLKLALFDVSNPSKPFVLDSIELDDTSSNAQYNHRAILVNKDKGYIAFDFNSFETEEKGAAVVTINDGKINVSTRIADVNEENCYKFISRVTYIGDTIYAFDENGEIYVTK